jgi:hypothetical protein
MENRDMDIHEKGNQKKGPVRLYGERGRKRENKYV